MVSPSAKESLVTVIGRGSFAVSGARTGIVRKFEFDIVLPHVERVGISLRRPLAWRYVTEQSMRSSAR